MQMRVGQTQSYDSSKFFIACKQEPHTSKAQMLTQEKHLFLSLWNN